MSRIITGSATSFSTAEVVVPGGSAPTKLVDARPGRKSVTIRTASESSHGGTFHIGPDSNVDGDNGYGIGLGDVIKMETEAEVWGVRPTAGGPISIGIIEVHD